MRSKKKASKTDPVVVAGSWKIPTSTILAVASLLFGGGTFAAGQMNSKKIDEVQQNQIDIATIKKDIEWIKNRLSEGDRRVLDSPKAP